MSAKPRGARPGKQRVPRTASEPKESRVKKPGETLSQYVKRRMAEEGPLTAAQEKGGFIDDTMRRMRKGVTIILGEGTNRSKPETAAPKASARTTNPTKNTRGSVPPGKKA